MKRTLLTLALLSSAAPAFAVKTQHFTNTSAEDFKKGEAHNVVATSTGQLRLSRQIDALLPKDRHFDAILAMAEAPDGSITFSAFPDGEVLSLKDGKLTTLATFKDQTVSALTYDKKGRLWIGVGGEKAKVVRIDKAGDEPKTICEPDDEKYVWAILPDGDDTFVATGPSGDILKIDAKDAADVFANVGDGNVLCLTSDKDNIYAGTDNTALVFKIDRKTAKPFVLYEAAESEISALAWDGHGNLLAATSEPPDESATALQKPEEANGPGKHPAANELPSKKPTAPKPPDEKPGDAIPKSTGANPLEPPTSEPAKPNESANAEANGNNADAATPSGTNAVYSIDPKGLVTEIFRKPVIIYGMAVHGDSILISTGSDGTVYELRPDADEENVLLRTDAPEATGLLTTKDGTMYVATSSAGQIYKLSANNATHGTYESDVLDAGVPSTFGNLHLLGSMPAGTKISVETRVGNIDDPDDDTWAAWTAPQPATAFVPIKSDAARFIQYRLTFDTNDAGKTPVVDEVDVAYQKPNLPPKITNVAVGPSGEAPGQMTVAWEASDGNEDELRFNVFVREVGQSGWMKIAEDLTESSHAWNAKGVADGQYEVKVVASDARANPPGEGREASRVSDGILVDNTPPAVGDVKTRRDGDKTVVTFRAVDRAGTVASVETTLDQVDHWQKQLPDDKMADSPEERYTVTLGGLGSGSHSLMIRATDERGNASFETVAIKVP